MKERWRQNIIFDDRYWVSSLGRVYSVKRKRILKPGPTGHGYVMVDLTLSRAIRRNTSVHTMVLSAFTGLMPEYPNRIVRHLDGNKTNNRLSNLKWGTMLENSSDAIKHGHVQRGTQKWNAQLTERDIPFIRQSKLSNRDLGTQYHVNQATIYDVKKRRTWDWV